jgi:uncharacterized protein YxjI
LGRPGQRPAEGDHILETEESDLENRIKEGHHRIAEVSKKWFRVRDTYGVEIDPGQNDIVILAATVAVDMMAHEGRLY